jgi:hypothetical protein
MQVNIKTFLKPLKRGTYRCGRLLARLLGISLGLSRSLLGGRLLGGLVLLDCRNLSLDSSLFGDSFLGGGGLGGSLGRSSLSGNSLLWY